MQHQPAHPVQFAHLPVACVLVDEKGTLFAANILAQEHFNTSEKKLVGNLITQFIAPENELLELLERASAGELISADSFYTCVGHKPYALHVSSQNDGFLSIVLIAEGNRLEAEAQSRRFEMAEAVSRIALERAHEIKNPLASLRGASQLLGEQVQGDQKEIVDHILLEIDRIKERVDGFLQVGPRANIKMEKVNVHLLIDGVCKGVGDVQVQRAYDPSIPDILVHAGRLRQAFENLWSNAIEAGSDLIVWETRVEHNVFLSGHKGVVLSVRVISNGQEIPEHIRSRMFDPYVTGKTRGNGLGLSIVQQVVQEHGGKVMVQSELMRTAFTLYLPIHTKNPKIGKK
ncbi:MAG: ATP-binding protein [Ghiorsea sp.]